MKASLGCAKADPPGAKMLHAMRHSLCVLECGPYSSHKVMMTTSAGTGLCPFLSKPCKAHPCQALNRSDCLDHVWELGRRKASAVRMKCLTAQIAAQNCQSNCLHACACSSPCCTQRGDSCKLQPSPYEERVVQRSPNGHSWQASDAVGVQKLSGHLRISWAAMSGNAAVKSAAKLSQARHA